jgi:hypothetical protein
VKLITTAWEELAFWMGFVTGAVVSAGVAFLAITLSALIVSGGGR